MLLFTAVLAVFLGYQARHFSLDASADSLLLEGDPDLEAFRQVIDRYGSEEFLVLTFTPEQPLFSAASLELLTRLRDEVRLLDGVESVVTVLDVPLLANPPVPLTELVSNIKTLEDPTADLDLARSELANSPLYVNLLLNLDANTTALQVNFPVNEERLALLDQRDRLQEALPDRANGLTSPELRAINEQLRRNSAERAAQVHQVVQQTRRIMDRFEPYGELHLSGLPMIADDITNFVRSDLLTFSLAVLFLVIATLTLIFRRPRWVWIPLLCCGLVVVFMLGILGLGRWPVTVISSNFISLLLILTLSMCIHLIVRYRELLRKHPGWPQGRLVLTTVRRIARPCFYMALTTGVAFISLLFSGIRPVINFGWMMALGIVCAYAVTFTVFPSALMLLGKKAGLAEKHQGGRASRFFTRLTLRSGNWLIVAGLALAAFTAVGISRLVVENSFIDYFDKSTEIYQGMSIIDQRLGGTTPLDVLINFESTQTDSRAPAPETGDGEGFVDENEAAFVSDGEAAFLSEDFSNAGQLGSFEDDFDQEDDPAKYWFTTDKIARIKALHQYLDAQPEIGKVISLATMMEVAESFNDGQPLTNVQLALLYTVIPKEFRDIVIEPYVSVEHDQVRINTRILDSMEGLKRDELLERIERDAVEQLGFAPGQVELTGMMVLYNNMLQSLFGSQVTTLGVVFAGILAMFLVLFRSFKLSLIAMVPNVLAASFVLGIMGWFGIPLDIMTITIASITIGIAVDNTIHYIVRYRREFRRDGRYVMALKRSHDTIGKAMYYTSLTIILGFSILMLSNFRPTLFFGLLTALAMAIALLGALTLLPWLIVVTRPFGVRRHHS
ncbi:MAG: efflux RND transporter permease subunit [Saccharospirillum sp.]